VTIPGAWIAVTVAPQPSNPGGPFTCAIKTDRTLWCWGSNVNGDLGLGSVTNTLRSLAGMVGTDFVRLAAAGDTVCALKSEGSLWCWGGGDGGLLGFFYSEDGNGHCGRPQPVANPVHIADGFVDVALDRGSGLGTAVRMTNGVPRLWAWGDLVGRLTAAPYPEGEGAEATQVAAGSYNWAVRKDGLIYEAVGAGPLVLDPGAPDNIIDLAARAWSRCAVTAGGDLWCRGSNIYGELGNGVWLGRDHGTGFVEPWQKVKGPQGVWVDVEVGDYSVCARHKDESVWCWGINTYGQLGDGTTWNRSVPSPVGQAPPPVSCSDGIANGEEIAVDCGGLTCPACPP